MSERIKVHHTWTNNEEELAIFLGDIIACKRLTMFKPFKKETNNNWVLDVGNNYWMFVISSTEIELQNRYDSDRFKALVEFCKVWLD